MEERPVPRISLKLIQKFKLSGNKIPVTKIRSRGEGKVFNFAIKRNVTLALINENAIRSPVKFNFQ